MTTPRSLLETMQAWIERTYLMETGIRCIERYVLGDRGYRRHYGGCPIRTMIGNEHGEAKVLVREGPGRVRAALYYPDALIAQLEQRHPFRGLDSGNIDAFGVFVEELDHLLTLADKAGKGRSVSLFELELHANVTKYYVAKQVVVRISGEPRLSNDDRRWLRHHLFGKVAHEASEPAVAERYRDAKRIGVRYIDYLEGLEGSARLRELRAFHNSPRRMAVTRLLDH